MIWGLVTAALVFYCLQAWISYLPDFKQSTWFVPTGCLLAVLCALCWYGIAKRVQGMELYKIGAWWDVAIAAAFLFVPVIASGIRPTTHGWVGVGMMLVGAWLINR